MIYWIRLEKLTKNNSEQLLLTLQQNSYFIEALIYWIHLEKLTKNYSEQLLLTLQQNSFFIVGDVHQSVNHLDIPNK